MKTLGYVWSVVINLITVFVVLSIYNSLNSSFENIVISGILLVYLTILTMGAGWYEIIVRLSSGLDNEFRRLRKLSGEEFEIDEEYETDTNQKIKKNRVKMYIGLGFNSLLYFLAIYKILSNI